MDESKLTLFFAARRGFYTDGVSFLVIVGLSPHEDKVYRVTERKLTEKGIQLGSFLLAKVVSSDVVKDFRLTNYSLEVRIIENIASVIVQSDKLVPCNNGELGFKTKPFGIVRAKDRNVQPGCYRIRITAESVPGEKERGCCHPIRLLCNFFSSENSLSSPVSKSPLCADVVSKVDSNPQPDPSDYENYPQPASRSSSTLYTSASRVSSISHHSQVSEDDRPRDLSDTDSIGKLIASLPSLRAPMPLPRTVKPAETPPSTSNIVVGGGFAVKIPERPKRKMTAFVVNIHDTPKILLYFLWICDIQEESIFRSNNHDLDRGHFFEGIFVKQDNEKQDWKCVKYLNEVDGLIEGLQIRDKIELTLPVLRYHPASDTSNYPVVDADYIGKIIDKNFKLPANCVGRNITVQRWRESDNSFKWIVTGILEN